MGTVVLSIGKLGRGQEDYYLSVVAAGVEDYYLGSGEAPGRWVGVGALRIGLTGLVDGDGLRAVLDGRDPTDPDRSLIAVRHERRVPGFDLTFSAPKGVSLLYALGGAQVADVVRAAHEAAVGQALGYLEREAGEVRRGENGCDRLAGGGFVAAAFRHRTSRAGDPQLHTHVLVANMTRGVDGRWSALDGQQLYGQAKTAGTLYQASLRWELRELGLDWQLRDNGLAEVAGISPVVLREFSRRRQQIEAEMDRRGSHSRAGAQTATLATRTAKAQTLDTVSQAAEWQTRAAAHGLTPDRLTALLHRRRPGPPAPAGQATITGILLGADGLTGRRSTFTRKEVLQGWASRLPDGAPVAAVETMTDRLLADPEVVPLGVEPDPTPGAGRSTRRHCTRDLITVERDLLTRADQPYHRSPESPRPASDRDLAGNPAGTPTGQPADLAGILAGQPYGKDGSAGPAWNRAGERDTGRSILAGPRLVLAGDDRNRVIDPASESGDRASSLDPQSRDLPGSRPGRFAGPGRRTGMWRLLGRRRAPLPAATAGPSSAPGPSLTRRSNPTRPAAVAGTVRWLSAEQQAMVDALLAPTRRVSVVVGKAGTGKTTALAEAHHQWRSAGIPVLGCALSARAAIGLQTGSGIPSTSIARLLTHTGTTPLPAGVVLVVDEAGMVGTRTLHQLLGNVENAGGQLVLVGDHKQLPELTAGGAFAALAHRPGTITLTTNRRQTHAWERAALDQLRDGDPTTTVTAWADHQRITDHADHETTIDGAVARWAATAITRAGVDSEVVLLAARRSDVTTLNHHARTAVHAAGLLTGTPVTVPHGDRTLAFAVGDLVVARRNDHRSGLINGHRGLVTATHPHDQILSVDFGTGPIPVTRAYLNGGGLDHGYALTIHHAQGLTVTTAIVYAGTGLPREAGYVATSRARHTTHLHLHAQHDTDTDGREHGHCGPPPDQDTPDPQQLLTAALHRSHAQELASTLER